MKTVSIKRIEKSKNLKGYEIYLGNGTIHFFTSQRSANKFLVDTGKFLTDQLFNLNTLLSEVYQHVRELLILSDNPGFDRKANQCIEHVEHFIDNCPKRSELKNGNYYAFIDLKKAAETLKILIKHLQSFRTIQTTDTLRRHKLNDLFQRVHNVFTRLQDYGQSDAFGFLDTSIIEDQNDLMYSLKIA